MKLLNSAIVITLVVVFSAATNGLECYRCRVSSCSHSYCEDASSILASNKIATSFGLSLDDFQTLPTCPTNFNDWNKTEFIQACPKESTSCGRHLFSITTHVKSNNINSNSSVVPVIGGGQEAFKSTIDIYACLMAGSKCETAPKLSLSKNISNSTEETQHSDELSIINDNTSCGQCEENVCNKLDLNTEQNTIHRPQNSEPNAVAKLTASLLLFLGAGLLAHV